ncbi:LapA family protein [Bacillus salacetis]|uniref:LapA family protein n=1 Tax=Bacillus salacetis TaxID=2315464 RepID=UPI003BA01A1B
MKFQWNLILGLIFALVVAIFAVINVDPVKVNYLFGESEWPLILVIIGSVLMGGLIVGSVGLFRLFVVQRKVKSLQKENERLKKEAEERETIAVDNTENEFPVDEQTQGEKQTGI